MNQNNNATKKEKKINFSPMQEWKNFRYFSCGDEIKQEAITQLKQRECLLPNDAPNKEKIKKDARYHATNFAKRLGNNGRAKRYGLQNIVGNIRGLMAAQELSVLYYYITNLYGMVYWSAPYNMQRMPVNPDAFGIYLTEYTKAFIKSLESINTEEAKPKAEKIEEAEVEKPYETD